MKNNAKRIEPNNGDPEIQNIPLAKIRTDKTQSRDRICKKTVQEYAEQMEAGYVLPAVVVYWDGETYWLADGFHRYQAAEKLEQKAIDCEVHQGTMRDALKYSFTANIKHGLRRTNADKRKAVKMAMDDEEWKNLSARDRAKLCGVSNTFVSNILPTLGVSTVDTPKATLAETEIGKGGKRRSAKKHRSAEKTSSGTSHGPVTAAANGKELSKNGTPDVSAKDVQHALDLLEELGTAMETLGLYEQHSDSIEQMLVSVEALELCNTNTIPNAPRDVQRIPR